MNLLKIRFLLIFLAFLSMSCEPKNEQNNNFREESNQEWQQKSKQKSSRKNHRQNDIREERKSYESNIPSEAYEVLKYVKANGQAPDGYVGGRKFGNFENRLPKKDANGRRINCQEWDIYPKKQGRNRGAKRLVTGSDGKSWYTGDHYDSFVEIKE